MCSFPVFLFSKVISLGPYLIAFSLQLGNCLFLMLASPKGGAQLWYQAALWQHHKFKSHLYSHGNTSIDFSFRVVFFPRLSAHGRGCFLPSLTSEIETSEKHNNGCQDCQRSFRATPGRTKWSLHFCPFCVLFLLSHRQQAPALIISTWYVFLNLRTVAWNSMK